MYKVIDELSKRLVTEEAGRAEAEKRTTVLEAEREGIDAKWRGELEAKQSTIATLQTHHAKQSASIEKLREEVVQLKGRAEDAERKAEDVEREVIDYRSQTEKLRGQFEAEKSEKESAEKELHAKQLALRDLRVEVEEVKEARQMALANVHSLEARLEHLTSEEGKKEVVEEYRHGPVGKVELLLAVKAGFDYLKAQIPSDVLSSLTFTYPPRVEGSLKVNQSLEERGDGVRLGDEEEDEDEEEEDDDDEGGDGNDGKDGGTMVKEELRTTFAPPPLAFF